MITTAKPFAVPSCQKVRMKLFTTPNTTGDYENSIFEKRKSICCFSRNLWIRS